MTCTSEAALSIYTAMKQTAHQSLLIQESWSFTIATDVCPEARQIQDLMLCEYLYCSAEAGLSYRRHV